VVVVPPLPVVLPLLLPVVTLPLRRRLRRRRRRPRRSLTTTWYVHPAFRREQELM
jgi:hypothetical protein